MVLDDGLPEDARGETIPEAHVDLPDRRPVLLAPGGRPEPERDGTRQEEAKRDRRREPPPCALASGRPSHGDASPDDAESGEQRRRPPTRPARAVRHAHF